MADNGSYYRRRLAWLYPAPAKPTDAEPPLDLVVPMAERLPWLYSGERKGVGSWLHPSEFASEGTGTADPHGLPDESGIRPQPQQLINPPARFPGRPARPVGPMKGNAAPPAGAAPAPSPMPEPPQPGGLREWLESHPHGEDKALLLHLFGSKDSWHGIPPEDLGAVRDGLGKAPAQQLLRILHGLNESGIHDPARHKIVHELLARRDDGPEVPLTDRNLSQAWSFPDDGAMFDSERKQFEDSLRKLPRVKGVPGAFLMPAGLDPKKVFGPKAGAVRLGQEAIEEAASASPTLWFGRPLPSTEEARSPDAAWRPLGKESYNADQGGGLWTVRYPDGRRYIAKKHADPGEADVEAATSGALRLLGVVNVPRMDVRPTKYGRTLFQSQAPGRELFEASKDELATIGKKNPPEKLASMLAGMWLLNADDRHWGNYLFTPEGHLYPIDLGFSLAPRKETRHVWGYNSDALLGSGLVKRDQQVSPDVLAKMVRMRKAVTDHVMKSVNGLEEDYIQAVQQSLDQRFDWLEQAVQLGHPVRLMDLPRLDSPRKQYQRAGGVQRYSALPLPHKPLVRLAEGSTHVPGHAAAITPLLTHTVSPYHSHNLAMTAGADAILGGKPAQHVHNAAWPHNLDPKDPRHSRRAESAHLGVHAEPDGRFGFHHHQGLPTATDRDVRADIFWDGLGSLPIASPGAWYSGHGRVEIENDPHLRTFLGAVRDAGPREKNAAPYHMLADYLNEREHPAAEGVMRSRDFPDVIAALAADPNPPSRQVLEKAGLSPSWDNLREDMDGGYTPTILGRSPDHQQLIRHLVGMGYPVYGGSGTGTIQPLLRRQRFARVGHPQRHAHESHPVVEKVASAAQDVHPDPSLPQREAGNHKMGHVRLHGLDITIETAKGQTRTKTGADGKPWSRKMLAHYGRIRRTEAADGDHLDVYIGDHPQSELVVVVEQLKESGKHDEYKCVLGCTSQKEAVDLYRSHHPAGWNRIGKVRLMTMPEFKVWAVSDKAAKPFRAARQSSQPSPGVFSRVESGEVEMPRAVSPAGAVGSTQVRSQSVDQSTPPVVSTPERFNNSSVSGIPLQGPLVGVQHHGGVLQDVDQYSNITHPMSQNAMLHHAAATGARAMLSGQEHAHVAHSVTPELAAAIHRQRDVPRSAHGMLFGGDTDGKVVAWRRGIYHGNILHADEPIERHIANNAAPNSFSPMLYPLDPGSERSADAARADIRRSVRRADRTGNLHAQVHIHPDPHFREMLKSAVLGGPAEAGIFADWLDERGHHDAAAKIRNPDGSILHHGPAVAGAIAEEMPGEKAATPAQPPAHLQTGRRVGRAMARDRWADELTHEWTGLDGQDADQLTAAGLEPGTPEWDAAEAEAERAFREYLEERQR